MKQSGKQTGKTVNEKNYKYVVSYSLLDQDPNCEDEAHLSITPFDAKEEQGFEYWSWDPRYTNLCWDADKDGYYEHVLCETENDVRKYISEMAERLQKADLCVNLHFYPDMDKKFASSILSVAGKSINNVIKERELPDENVDYSDKSNDDFSLK